jgi:FlaA1/EpsC-like NDP-sugar epimerase
MTIPEAAQLVLQAFSMGEGGEVFVLDMGESVKIVDLARNLILLSGLQPDKDIKIEFSGVRPGEKLFEEVNLTDECLIPTAHAKIRSYVCPLDVDARQIRAHLQTLKHIVEVQDVAGLVLLLKELIPDYNPTSRLLNEAFEKASNHTGPVAHLESNGHGERTAETRLAPVILMN